ncbi:MAG: HEPN domain-containing protein [Candidatus Aminicenantes bacterium]|jgi:uncharacterized protein (UPF0332 family)
MEFKEDLIKYRIGRSENTIEEAELAIKNNKLPLAENRIYYSIFYIVSALALKYDFSTSKHSTLMGWFNQALVKTEKIDVSFGKTYSRAFEKRRKADYDDYVTFNPEEVNLDLENAKKFVKRIKKYIAEEQEQDTE